MVCEGSRTIMLTTVTVTLVTRDEFKLESVCLICWTVLGAWSLGVVFFLMHTAYIDDYSALKEICHQICVL
jgi:hypothetical protein